MKILVIEDEQKLAYALKRALELQKYRVETAFDGEEGLEKASVGSYDLLIVDYLLPNLDGVELIKELRTENREVPVIMLTAKDQVKDKVAGLDAGADDYMAKPFALEELFSRIRALTRRSANSNEEILTAGTLQLNPHAHTVKRQGKNIHLSVKEFSLLEYLLRHKGAVVSKEDIVRHVWEYDSDVLLSTVEVHIKHLRDKVDKPFTEPLVQTVRGFGYTIK